MKVLLLFIVSFILLSALPFLWNQFTLEEVGFPFVYLRRSVFESSDYAQDAYIFANLNLIYNLVLIAIAVWAFTRIRTAARNRV